MMRRLTMKCHTVLVLLGTVAMGLSGCASDRKPTTRPTSALNDPMDYKPNMDDTNISGGKVGEYDREGMRRDVDHVLNP
jgi:hypothetical protein